MTAAGHRAVLAAMVFLTLGALLIAVQDGDTDGRPASAQGTTPITSTTAAGPTTSAATTASTVPTTTAAPTTTVAPAVSVPVGAVGAFTPAAGETAVTGTGNLVTYTVEVEDAVGYSADEFARVVDTTPADPRSWIADGSLSVQRVASGGQVRIVLATPATVDGLCLPLDTAGLYSCHQGGTVALNSTRWLQGTENWPGPLDEFRHYAVNHEFGHAIGHGHEYCGGAGQPAPVMMQQSKGLEGCLPNGWPYPEG
jgi:Protein of unknown function (DUF3152)